MTIKDSKYVKINSVNPLQHIFSEVNWYFEEINKSKYLMLVPTNKSKEKFKKWRTLEYSDRELPLNKVIKILSVITVVRAVFYEQNKYYPQVTWINE